MELTWKDKISFQVQEIRSKLPFYDQPKRQNIFIGEIAGVCCCLLILLFVGFIFLLPRTSSKTTQPDANHVNPQSNQSEGGTQQITQQTQPETLNQPQLNTTQNNTNNNTQTNNQTSHPTAGIPATTSPIAQIGSSNIASVQFVGKFLSGTTSQNTAAIYGSSPSTTGETTDITHVTLEFKDQNGDVTKYVDTEAPPINITWQTYINDQDKYAIDVPVGWDVIKTTYNGHEGLAVYPQGTDTSQSMQEGLKQIGFGVSPSSYESPYLTSGNAVFSAPITITGYSGTLYTQGSYGANTVAALINYNNVFFGIAGTANSDDMIYVFQHMLESLQLYGK